MITNKTSDLCDYVIGVENGALLEDVNPRTIEKLIGFISISMYVDHSTFDFHSYIDSMRILIM